MENGQIGPLSKKILGGTGFDIYKYKQRWYPEILASKIEVAKATPKKAIKAMANGESQTIPLYTIGTAARILGISVHTIRMYERNGLIVPHRSDSRQKRYADSDIERLRCIRNAINVQKISIQGIRSVLSLIPCWVIVQCAEEDRQECPAYHGHSEPCWAVKQKAPFCRERDCRSCEVYNDYAECKTIKQRLRSLLSP